MKKNGSLQTPFEGAVISSKDSSGDWANVTNGLDIPGGQKGTAGVMPEVTTVKAGTVGDVKQVTVQGIANR